VTAPRRACQRAAGLPGELAAENNRCFRAATLLRNYLPCVAPLCNTKRGMGKQKAADPFESTACMIFGGIGELV